MKETLSSRVAELVGWELRAVFSQEGESLPGRTQVRAEPIYRGRKTPKNIIVYLYSTKHGVKYYP